MSFKLFYQTNKDQLCNKKIKKHLINILHRTPIFRRTLPTHQNYKRPFLKPQSRSMFHINEERKKKKKERSCISPIRVLKNKLKDPHKVLHCLYSSLLLRTIRAHIYTQRAIWQLQHIYIYTAMNRRVYTQCIYTESSRNGRGSAATSRSRQSSPFGSTVFTKHTVYLCILRNVLCYSLLYICILLLYIQT